MWVPGQPCRKVLGTQEGGKEEEKGDGDEASLPAGDLHVAISQMLLMRLFTWQSKTGWGEGDMGEREGSGGRTVVDLVQHFI